MRKRKIDRKNRFVSSFDTETGFYMRTGVINDQGVETDEDPFMTDYPELIDVGIMGHCEHGKSGLCMKAGIECYQSGLSLHKPNMSVSNFEKICMESSGKTFQIALGGRGDPNKHEHFEAILKTAKKYDIVPNYTTSGLGLTDREIELTKEYCGAVAVSWYRSDYTLDAIRRFSEAGCTTNIHYVLSVSSIKEAIQRLEENSFPEGVSAVIFLTHKPVGLGSKDNVLGEEHKELLERFFSLVDQKRSLSIGFDSCTIPMLLRWTKNIAMESLDTCEGARWSMYISSDMTALPCSFDQDYLWGVDLCGNTIHEAWYSEQFEDFRNSFRNACPSCPKKASCMGGCPIVPEIVNCGIKNKGVDNNE